MKSFLKPREPRRGEGVGHPAFEAYQTWARENPLLHAIHIEHHAATMVADAWKKLTREQREALPPELRAALFVQRSAVNRTEEVLR